MRRIDFHTDSSIEELLDLKARFASDGLVLAGGTDLVIALRDESLSLPAAQVIDITRIAGLGGISVAEGDGTGSDTRIRLGPLVTHTRAELSPEIAKWAQLLARACSEVGSPQIRNRGTIGGNICNASPCADTVPPLVALGAELTIRSVRGTRTERLEDVITAPYKTSIARDEVLADIRFEAVPDSAGTAFIKLGRRNALSISRMSMAVIVDMAPDGSMREVRVAAGSVAPMVRRFPGVENLLAGKAPDNELLRAAGEELAREMIIISGRRWSTPYKEPVVATLLRRALARAVGLE